MSEDKDPGVTECMGEHGSNPATPRTSGDVILVFEKCQTCSGTGFVNLGDCPDCKGSGKSSIVREEWKVSSFEQRIKAQFEQWVRRRAKLAIAEAEAEDGPEEASAMRTAYIAAYGAGHYNWNGRHCRSAMSDLPGLQHLIYLLLRRCNSEMTEAKANQIYMDSPRECGMALGWAMGNSESPPIEGKNGASNGTNGKTTTTTKRKSPVTMDD